MSDPTRRDMLKISGAGIAAGFIPFSLPEVEPEQSESLLLQEDILPFGYAALDVTIGGGLRPGNFVLLQVSNKEERALAFKIIQNFKKKHPDKVSKTLFIQNDVYNDYTVKLTEAYSKNRAENKILFGICNSYVFARAYWFATLVLEVQKYKNELFTRASRLKMVFSNGENLGLCYLKCLKNRYGEDYFSIILTNNLTKEMCEIHVIWANNNCKIVFRSDKETVGEYFDEYANSKYITWPNHPSNICIYHFGLIKNHCNNLHVIGWEKQNGCWNEIKTV